MLKIRIVINTQDTLGILHFLSQKEGISKLEVLMRKTLSIKLATASTQAQFNGKKTFAIRMTLEYAHILHDALADTMSLHHYVMAIPQKVDSALQMC